MKVFIAICFLLFTVHQVLQKVMGVSIAIVDSYLDPLLCMPLVLFLLDWERQRIWHSPNLSIGMVLCLTLVLAVIFEFAFPVWNSGFTMDYLDVLLYFIGATLYLVVRYSNERLKT